MLKLTASYSKKVPVPESEYSSQSYHCCVEIEIAEGLSKDQLDSRIHETFSIVKNSVENELHGGKVHSLSTPEFQAAGRSFTRTEKRGCSGKSEADQVSAGSRTDERSHARTDQGAVSGELAGRADPDAVFQSHRRTQRKGGVRWKEPWRKERANPHWSFSALNTYLNVCSLKFYFQYIEHAPRNARAPALLSDAPSMPRSLLKPIWRKWDRVFRRRKATISLRTFSVRK